MVNIEYNEKNVYTDFDTTSETDAEKIASLVRKLRTDNSDNRKNGNTMHIQEKRTKTTFAKRVLCCLKIS